MNCKEFFWKPSGRSFQNVSRTPRFRLKRLRAEIVRLAEPVADEALVLL